MTKIKTINLTNFKGYTNVFFDFTQSDFALFYGPNGIGKSTVLEAINLAANPLLFKGRAKDDSALYLRSLIHDEDYNPVADHVLTKEKNDLKIEAVFAVDGEDRKVVLTQNGFEVNELPAKHGGYAFYADSDHASNWAKFQLTDEEAPAFVELAEAIYGYKCDLDGEVNDEHYNEYLNETVKHLFYQDFILHKGSHKVHFAQMSAGEKKLATLLRQLCNPDNTKDRDILLIDNIEMHVYFKRHAKMLDKLRERFNDKQIIATTHSINMIRHAPPRCRFDLEIYRPEYAMSDQNEKKPEENGIEQHYDEFPELEEIFGDDFPRKYPDGAAERHPYFDIKQAFHDLVDKVRKEKGIDLGLSYDEMVEDLDVNDDPKAYFARFSENVNAKITATPDYTFKPITERRRNQRYIDQYYDKRRKTPTADEAWVLEHPGYNSENGLERNAILIDLDEEGHFQSFDPIEHDFAGQRLYGREPEPRKESNAFKPTHVILDNLTKEVERLKAQVSSLDSKQTRPNAPSEAQFVEQKKRSVFKQLGDLLKYVQKLAEEADDAK